MTDISIIIPCLNEAKTLAYCIEKAKAGITSTGLSGEIIVADNDSVDDSATIAQMLGARVVSVPERGYGSAIRGGIREAQGTYVVIGDADGSYDFSAIKPFISKMKDEHCDLVIGNRFTGSIEKDAMPFLNKYLGNPGLSFMARMLFGNVCGDFHSGLRAAKRSSLEKLHLKTTGMEFATEMIVAAAVQKIKIGEVPITLYKDGRTGPSHLRRWRDGMRHIKFMLNYKYGKRA